MSDDNASFTVKSRSDVPVKVKFGRETGSSAAEEQFGRSGTFRRICRLTREMNFFWKCCVVLMLWKMMLLAGPAVFISPAEVAAELNSWVQGQHG